LRGGRGADGVRELLFALRKQIAVEEERHADGADAPHRVGDLELDIVGALRKGELGQVIASWRQLQRLRAHAIHQHLDA